MPSPQFTPTIGTTQPDPNLTIKVYDAVNNGSFAIILVAVGGIIYLKRSAKEFLQSPFANSLLNLIKQIETNQEHIENIAVDVDRLDKSTADMLDLVAKLQQEILRAGELSTAQHTMIMKELRQVRIILDRRGSKNVDNH
jgi:hypothetical protein